MDCGRDACAEPSMNSANKHSPRRDRFIHRPVGVLLLTAVLGLLVGLTVTGQEPSTTEPEGAVFAVRRAVQAELALGMVDYLGDGHLAILPPEVPEGAPVTPAIADGWETGMAEALLGVEGDVKLTERADLTAILREQKFADSAYADPDTATEVGRIAAARTLLLTRLLLFRPEGPAVRVHLEARLIDVETGGVLWARELRRGLLPPEIQALLVGIGLVVGLPLLFLVVRVVTHRRRRGLVEQELPKGLAHLREAIERLERALARSRTDLGADDAASEAVQGAFQALEPELLRLRALPGGSVDRQRARDLGRAQRLARDMADALTSLREAVESGDDAEAVAAEVRQGIGPLRRQIDDYRGLFL